MPDLPRSIDPSLPSHVEDAVTATAKMALEHHLEARRLERWIENVTMLIARPAFAPVLTMLVIFWTGLNFLLEATGLHAVDPPPFYFLFDFVALAALYLTGIILATQRREGQLSTRREELNLQLCILIEQKAAKLLELSGKAGSPAGTGTFSPDPKVMAMAESADVEKMLLANKIAPKPVEE